MICLMHESDGYLLINNAPVGIRQLASLASLSHRDCEKLVKELEKSGVFSLTETGVIFSRRIKRDIEKANKDKENGNKGGNPVLVRGVNPPVNGHDKAQKLEARIPEEDRKLTLSCPKPVRTKTDYSSEFEEFWSAYPTDPNMSKKTAYAQFTRLTPDDRADAIKSLSAFKIYCSGRADYRPVHAERYLSQRRFDGFKSVQERSGSTILVKVDTPQWFAWERWYRDNRNTSPPVSQRDGGWRFPSEWPVKNSEEAA